MPELQKDIEKLVSQLVSAYWLTLDEKRIAMNYEPLGGEFAKAFINSALTPIEDISMADGMINDYANGNNNRTRIADDLANGDD